MSTSKRELSGRVNGNGKSEIILRLSICRGVQPRIRTGIFITPSRFNDGKKDPTKAGCIIMPRANQTEAAELRKLEADIIDAERYLLDLCNTTPKEQISKDFLTDALDRYRHPERYTEKEEAATGFYELFDKFIHSRPLSDRRVKLYKALTRSLKQFEAYRSTENGKPYKITVDGFSTDDLNRFEAFLRNEPEIAAKYPELYKVTDPDADKRAKRKALPKGNNTIVCTFKRLRAFFNWCNGLGISDNKPFAKYTGITSEHYGTPYYITNEERDIIADFDLSATPALETQRDIFIFQCLIGCRVSDLMRLTPSNIINGAVEYVASKTRQERPDVIRVPLHRRALEIIRKYAFTTRDGRLLPFISQQRYNDAIKKIFTVCGIGRAVTTLNPTTSEEEQHPINEVASSHLARRTFVGNLYKQVKDPDLISKLSGHTEGSRAFNRYRDIDEDMKKDLIKLLGD